MVFPENYISITTFVFFLSQLAYCVVQFLEKDAALTEQVSFSRSMKWLELERTNLFANFFVKILSFKKWKHNEFATFPKIFISHILNISLLLR